jgi:hypothetical protein
MIVASLTGCLMRCSVQLQRRRHDQGTAFLFPDRTNCEADSRASNCTSFLFQGNGFATSFCPSSTNYMNTTAVYSLYTQLVFGSGGSSVRLIKIDRATGLHPRDDPCLMPILYLKYETVYPAPHPYLSIYLSTPSHLSQRRSSL